MQYSSYNFFPIQISHIKSNLKFTKEKEYVRSLKSTFKYGKHTGGYQGAVDINVNELTNVKKLIDSSILKVYNRDYEILEIWGSILGQGDYNKIHNHPALNPYYNSSSIKVGILYIETVEGSILDVHSPSNPTNTTAINVNEGDLLFADAYMLHSVPPHSSTQERICIAFNFIIK